MFSLTKKIIIKFRQESKYIYISRFIFYTHKDRDKSVYTGESYAVVTLRIY